MKHLSLIPLAVSLLFVAACTHEDILDGADTTGELTNPELAWSASSASATIGATNTFPTLSNEYGVTVNYTSSDTSVATIDSEGKITLLSAGTTAITAASEATLKYSASSASYALTVTKGEDGISWSETTWSVSIKDESPTFPTLNNPGGQTITYSSSNALVAAIDAKSGEITLITEGEVTITASAEANDSYEASTASYVLSIEGNLTKAGLYWDSEVCTVTLGVEGNTYPALNNPYNLTVSYSSSDTSVATIDSSTGAVTLVSAGTTTIIATTEADETYAAGSAAYTLKVVKQTTSLSWSESTFKAILEEDNDFPVLTTDPDGLSVNFSSSNESVATIAADGSITLSAVGSTVISAVFEGNDTYKSSSASYTLTVVSGTDTGAGTYTFDSSGDTSSDDDISLTTFTRMITVTWSGSIATVEGDYYGYATTSGGHVTVTNTGNDENIVYKLTGSTTNGSFTLTSSKKQAILLSGVSITNPAGAAINNQSGKRTYVLVEGTNYLYDSSSAAYSTDTNTDMKAVFFSEGQLVFSGSGTLTVEAKNKKEKSCIASDDYVRIMNSPTLKLTSSSTTAGHGIRGKEYVQLSGGNTTISSAASMKKGITSENYVLVEGGTHTIKITGGVGYDSEDGEYKGTAGIKADNYFGMTGGTVTITNSGSGGKGLRAGSEDYNDTGVIEDSYISGGTLTITTTGSESNDVSCKGIKIGWSEGTESRVTANDGGITISGGVVKVSSSKSEGFESKDHFTMTGGEVYVTSSADDAVNCTGEMKISGGYIYANSSKNDALDANGNLTLSGGYVFAVTTAGGAEVAIDCAEQKTLTIGTGVVMVAYPSIESGAKMNQSCYTMSCTAGSWNSLYNGSSNIAAFKAPSGVSTVVVSAPSLKSGYKGVSVGNTTYCNGIWATSSISGGSSVSLSNYSGGNTGGGPGGGGRSGGGGRW